MKQTILKMLLLLSVLFVSVGSTVAYLTDVDKEVNVMTLDRVEIDLIEEERNASGTLVEFQDNHPLYPGFYPKGLDTYDKDGYWVNVQNAVDKVVTVKNTGKAPAYVCLWFAFEVTDDHDFFRDKIHLNTNSEDWQWTVLADDEDGDYIFLEQNDTRYVVYIATYNKVLASGATTPVSLRQVLLDSSATNDDLVQLGDKYSIFVVAQGMQSAGFDKADQALNEGFGVPSGTNHPFAGMKAETSNTEVPLVGMRAKSSLNVGVYISPSTDADMACIIPADTVVDVLSLITVENREWYYVSYNGKKGYVRTTMLEIVPVEEPKEDPDDGLNYGEAQQNDVPVMREPRIDATILFKINKGYEFQIIDFVIDSETMRVTWIKVLCKNPADEKPYTGYIAWEYANIGITPDSNEKDEDDPVVEPDDETIMAIGMIVNTNGVNFREKADNNSASMAQLTAGTTVEILSAPSQISRYHFYRVRYNGTVGYIQSPYIEVVEEYVHVWVPVGYSYTTLEHTEGFTCSLCRVYEEGNTSVHSFNNDGKCICGAVDPNIGANPMSDFKWEKSADGNGIRITQYIGSDTEVVIPATIEGVLVTEIGMQAFHNCTRLTSITIPSDLTSIGDEAFAGCTSMTTVALQGGGHEITSIGASAFQGCTSLSSIKRVRGLCNLTFIGEYAFENCSQLTEFFFGQVLSSLGTDAFKGCSKITIYVEPYNKYAFAWCIKNGIPAIETSGDG